MRAPYADRNCWSVLKPLIPVLPFRYKNQRTGAAATVRMEAELLTYLAALVILQKRCLLASNGNRLFYFPPHSSRVFPWRCECLAQASRLLRHFICRLWPAALVAGRHAVRDHRRGYPHAKYFVEQCRTRDPETSPREIAHTQRHRSRIVRPPGRAHPFLRLLPAKSEETEGFCALLASGIDRKSTRLNSSHT